MKICVAVTTYNSSQYVIETLESVFNQSHQEIELIISDDFSTDNTIEVVESWIDRTDVKKRFDSIQLLKVTKNTGISANCNRMLKACQSEYIKMIAGDDILFPKCLEENLNFVLENPKANIIFSKVEVYKNDFQKINLIRVSPDVFPVQFMGEEISAESQFKMLLVSDRIKFTPSFFFKKEAIIKIGGYDEQNRLIEDYPMWLKLTKSGEKLYFFDKVTVGYRAHEKSLSNSGEATLFQISYRTNFQVRKLFVFQYLSKLDIANEYFIFFLQQSFDFFGLNKKNIFSIALYKLFFFYLNPFYIIKKF